MCEQLEKWISALVGIGKKKVPITASKMRARVLTAALSVCVALTTMPVTAFSAEIPEGAVEAMATEAHQHPVCGTATCAGDHTSHASDVEYVALDDGAGKIKQANLDDQDRLKPGNYYLTAETTRGKFIGFAPTTPAGTVNLCLNGKTLVLTDGSLIASTKEALNVCDCTSGGKIISTDTGDYASSAISSVKGAEFNLYGGTIQANYGGDVLSLGTETVAGIYGGTIENTGSGYGISLSTTVTLAGSPSIPQGITRWSGGEINLSGEMKNTNPIKVDWYYYWEDELVLESDGTYSIKEADAEKFTLSNSGYTLKLKDGRAVMERVAHKHPVCGKTPCARDHTSHTSDVDYFPLNNEKGEIEQYYRSGSEIKPGNYYLTQDTTDQYGLEFVSGETVNLCLNGKTLTTTEGFLDVAEDATLNICDCGGGGKIVTKAAKAIIRMKGEVNLYGGTLQANRNDECALALNSGAVAGIYGGTITNTGSGKGIDASSGTLTMAGGPSIAQGIKMGTSLPIKLSSEMTNSSPIVVTPTAYTEGDFVLESDGKYAITAEDVAKFALADSGYKLKLEGDGVNKKAVVANNTPDHKHPVCGTTTCAGDHDSHKDSNVTYVALDDGAGKIKDDKWKYGGLKSGNYYLTQNTTYESNILLSDNGQGNLCLNGKTLTLTGGSLTIYKDNMLNICDCGSGGKIVTKNADAIINRGKVDLYGGTIQTSTNNMCTLKLGSGAVAGIYGGTLGRTVTGTGLGKGIDASREALVTLAGAPSIPDGILLQDDTVSIKLSGEMKNSVPIVVTLKAYTEDAVVLKSDGSYIITAEDMAKFTLADSGYKLRLEGDGAARTAVVEKVKQPTKPLQMDNKSLAFSGNKALFTVNNNGTDAYQGAVTFKLYESRTGGTAISDKIEKIDNTAFYVAGVTAEKTYYVTATEVGYSESARERITVYPASMNDSVWGTVYFNTLQELEDYLNLMKPDSASLSASTVTLSEDVTIKHDMEFLHQFSGTINMDGKTVIHASGTTGEAITTQATRLTLKNGTLETSMPIGILSRGGETVLNQVNVKGVWTAVYVEAGKLDATESNLTVASNQENTATLVAEGGTVIFHSGTLKNEVTREGEKYTYVGTQSLSGIVAEGSYTEQKSTEIMGDQYDGFQGCTEEIVVTKGKKPSSQSKIDQIFGAGNATFVESNSITINKDIILDDTVTIDKNLIGEDVTLNLNGKTITVKETTGDGKDAIVAAADVNLTIKGPGKITGGNGSGNGAGGNAISGSGNVTITGGATITGGNGAGTGAGGNGIKTTGSGNITITGGGASIGGIGGNGNNSTAGGTGGIGVVASDTGTITVGSTTGDNGSVTGGNGGNGAGNGSGNAGNGGAGAQGNSTGVITGTGTITGGNGGNIPEGGTGTLGSGGAAISAGGDSFSGTATDGQAGLKANAKVEMKPGAPTVNVPDAELINGAVTEADRKNTDISKIEVTLTVKKEDNPKDKDKADGAANGQKIGVYLDIVLEKKITTSSGTTPETVKVATQPITITVTIPDEMKSGSEYKIIRVHDGTAEVITPTHDKAGNTLTFETNKFSTYAIAYTPTGGSGGGGPVVTPPVGEDDHVNTPTTGEIQADVTVDQNGKATATVEDKAVSEAIKTAEEEAKKNGNLNDGITLTIHVNTKDKGAKYIAFNLSKATQEMIIAKKINKTFIVVDNPKVKITLNLATIKEINRQANGDVLISAALTSGNKLSTAAKKAIGTRPAFDLRATYNGGTITDLGKGRISVEIPYTMRKGETASGLMTVSVGEKGNASYSVNSSYKAKKISFNVSKMGIYGVGYKKSTTFTDTKKHWAKEDIAFAVSRSLISGTSKTKFSPNTAMSRADFVTVLGKIAGVKSSDYKKSSFTDVKNSAAYMPYVEWAVKNGIIKDMGNGKFSPKGTITREEMALILQNFAELIGLANEKGQLPKLYEKNVFADAEKISTWAKDAVKAMQMAGIIMGERSNRFDPQGKATRAQASAMVKRLIELMIDDNIANGWQQNHSGGWMYFVDGKVVKSQTKKIDGKKHTFDRYGVTTSYPLVKKPVVQKPDTTTRTYKVRRGDSFWIIAKRYKVNMYTLARINGKTVHSVIHQGDILKIPK